MDWPAYSPDLNPIEHVWDALWRRIEARLHHPENTQQLKQMLIEEWALLPQEMLHQLVLSMRRRCEATIAGFRHIKSVEAESHHEGVVWKFVKLQSGMPAQVSSSSLGIGSKIHRDEAHIWLNGYVNKQNCRIWSEANPQVYVETPLYPEKLTVWWALWAGGILLQKR
ncbi:transposable element Tcb2 transposase [Trichonephila clavipes]|nr:transposable element Tcb2 transposase [Trichonephila clavipes]